MMLTQRQRRLLQAALEYAADCVTDLNEDAADMPEHANFPEFTEGEILQLGRELLVAVDTGGVVMVSVAPEPPTPPPARHVVFVYGTLKRGMHNHEHFLGRSTYLGDAATPYGYRLYHAAHGGYPYLVADPDADLNIQGELHEVDDATLRELDRLEGVPHHYRREQIQVNLAEGLTRTAFVYLYNGSVSGLRDAGTDWQPISHDWERKDELVVEEKSDIADDGYAYFDEVDDRDPTDEDEEIERRIDEEGEDVSLNIELAGPLFKNCPALRSVYGQAPSVSYNYNLLSDGLLELTKLVAAQAREIARLKELTAQVGNNK